MKGCIQLIEGDPSSLVVSDSVPMPSVGPYDILIRVSAIETNARVFVLYLSCFVYALHVLLTYATHTHSVLMTLQTCMHLTPYLRHLLLLSR